MNRAAAVSVVVLTGLIVLGAAALAHADARQPQPRSHSSVPTVRSPAEPGLTLGLSGAQTQLATGSAASIGRWNARAHAVGAQMVRLSIGWSSVAPTTRPSGFVASNPNSPGYDWSGTDSAVEDLTREGYTVLLQVTSAPKWAEGSGMPRSATPGTWEPDATDFGQFATALATRYDGRTPDPAHPGTDLPRVSDWQAWNEPNLTIYLAPQWVKTGSQEVPQSPGIYRRLENAFYTSVTRVASSNFVVGAGTAPYGDPPGGQRMPPVTFDQNLFCLNSHNQRAVSCPGATELDAIDDHPYVSGLCCEAPTTHALDPGDTSIPDMYKIADVLTAAEKAHTVAPAGHTALWATEIGWNTDPPNPNATQASPAAEVGRWATQALYILWSQGVSTVLWYELADEPEASGGWIDTTTEGLYYLKGTAKPAAAAFRFPFLTNRRTPSRLEAWGRAPKAGTLTIQRLAGKRWVAVERLAVRADQVFEAPVPQTGAASFRAVVGGLTSPAWAQSG